jgi:Fic family protein
MPGKLVRRIWQYDPTLYAPARYRRACEYDAFTPAPLADIDLTLPGDVAGVISDAERAIANLNHAAGPELMPLARLLLRTESIASSKVEGMHMDARKLARAEANQEIGRGIGPQAAEILANVDAMQLAIERASSIEAITPEDVIDIHRVLMSRAPNSQIAGRIRTTQNWIGGNDYNPCGADFVPPPHDEVVRLLDDLARFCNQENLPTLIQAAVAHAQFETIHPFEDGNGRTGRALVQIVLRLRGLAPSFVPPVSIVLARHRDRYIGGLDAFREDRIGDWLEMFAVATRQATDLAAAYTQRVSELQDR